jgi:hypothetical protein
MVRVTNIEVNCLKFVNRPAATILHNLNYVLPPVLQHVLLDLEAALGFHRPTKLHQSHPPQHRVTGSNPTPHILQLPVEIHIEILFHVLLSSTRHFPPHIPLDLTPYLNAVPIAHSCWKTHQQLLLRRVATLQLEESEVLLDELL